MSGVPFTNGFLPLWALCLCSCVVAQPGTNFVPYTTQMIITNTTNETVLYIGSDGLTHFTADAAWNDPTVIKRGDGDYVMWLTRNVLNGTFPPTSPVQPYSATSTDGYVWDIQDEEPVFNAPVNRSGYDGIAAETPTVRLFNGKYHMFSTAEPNNTGLPTDPFPWFIGHYHSSSGEIGSWTRATEPIFELGNGTFYELFAAEPGAVVYNGVLMVYFVTVSLSDGLYSIGVSTSTDGMSYSDPVFCFDMRTSLDYPTADRWLGPSTPSVIVLGGQVHMYHGVYRLVDSEYKQYAVTHSFSNSSDGIGAWITDPWPPLFQRSDFYWSHDELRSGEIVEDGPTLRLYLAGQSIGTNISDPPYLWRMGIGLAESPNPFYEEPTEPSADSSTSLFRASLWINLVHKARNK